MKNSTGIVMQHNKKNAFIMTNTGEFLKVKVNKEMPNIGEVYTGEVVKEMPIYKYAATAASLALVLLFGSAAYAYNTPVASMVIDINPSIKLDVNRWDRIIKSVPLNNDGEKVLESLNIKNKQLNEGLNLIIDEAKKDNYINSNYIESGKVITLSIENNKLNKHYDLSKFEDYVKENKLVVEVKDEKTDNKNSTDKNRSKSSNGKADVSDKKSGEIKDNNSSNPGNDNTSKNNNSGSDNTFSNNGNKDNSVNNSSNASSNANSNSNVTKDKKDKSTDNNSNNGHDKQKDKDNDKEKDKK